MTDTTLRVGRILAAYDVGDKGSSSKQVTQYDVSVRQADGNGMPTDVVYPRVVVANLFGGATDFFRWTPRIDNFDNGTQVGHGSRVLLLCVNGNQRQAYIIGGIPNPEDTTPVLPYKDNHHMEFQFNGIYANVDKDGTFTMIHRGATGPDDKVTDTTGQNSSIQFDKNGNITLGYNFGVPTSDNKAIVSNSDDLPYITLQKQVSQVSTYAPSDIANKTNKRFLIETSDGVKVNANGSDQQAWLRATTYRDKQQTMNNNLMTLITQLGTVLSLVVVQLQAASIALKPPVGGSTAGSVPIGLAATQLMQGSSIISSMVQEIQTFEQSTTDYLSPSHFHADKP